MAAPDALLAGLAVYEVGGAVRDALLGLPAGDRDWVVVGATPQIMAARGFVPVGGDFPVFLHPRTHEEYALARTERKSARGYKGFVFHAGQDVSLEEDLRRRDLTINAIARGADGALIDPLGGVADLRARCLRHVGAAFLEDPVRLLRLARFAARFSDFTIAAETTELCRAMVANGEVDALVPERVWQEIAKGLMYARPERMLGVLKDCGALARLNPELIFNDLIASYLRRACAADLGLAQRYALLCAQSPLAASAYWRAPQACVAMAQLLVALLGLLQQESAPQLWLQVINHCDALRRPERFAQLLAAAACVLPQLAPAVWQARLQALAALDTAALARAAGPDGARIRAALQAARLQVLENLPQDL